MSLRYALLGLLSDGPASGYDLLRTFKHSLANVWPTTQSQIYTELTKLADAGLIEVSDEGPRGRKEYTLTDTGLDDLRTWLTTTEPKQAVRNEALLRIFFLGVIPVNRPTPISRAWKSAPIRRTRSCANSSGRSTGTTATCPDTAASHWNTANASPPRTGSGRAGPSSNCRPRTNSRPAQGRSRPRYGGYTPSPWASTGHDAGNSSSQ